MTVTEQQARALAFLASALRPHGASRWDEAGIYANVMKVRDRSLGQVAIAVIQAAEDRNAASPGVIPTAGPHWRDPQSAPMSERPDVTPLHDSCSTCLLGRAEHARRWGDDHPWAPNIRRPYADAEHVASRLEYIRSGIGDAKAERVVDEPEPLPPLPEVDRLRELAKPAACEHLVGPNPCGHPAPHLSADRRRPLCDEHAHHERTSA